MRELRYRAWHRNKKCWYYFSLMDLLIGNVTARGGLLLENWCEYITLKDRDDKGIYEEDIVEYTSNDGKQTGQYKVEWYEYKCGYILSGINKQKDLWVQNWSRTQSKIIGNTYENPELLEEKQ